MTTRNQDHFPEGNEYTDPNNNTSKMQIKRSVSPDGRIDALSVEFLCLVEPRSPEQVRSHAQRILMLQGEIVDQFLNGDTTGRQEPSASDATGDEAVFAKMLNIGGIDGKWGRRPFIRFDLNGRILRRYGTWQQLAECIVAAGYPKLAQDLAEGDHLNLPCRVITKLSSNGRFLNVDTVLPSDR